MITRQIPTKASNGSKNEVCSYSYLDSVFFTVIVREPYRTFYRFENMLAILCFYENPGKKQLIVEPGTRRERVTGSPSLELGAALGTSYWEGRAKVESRS